MKEYPVEGNYIIQDVGFDNILEVKHPSFKYEDEVNEIIRHRIEFPTKSAYYKCDEWHFEIAYIPRNENEEPKYEKWDLSDEDEELFKHIVRNVIKPRNLIEQSINMTLAERKQMINDKLVRDKKKQEEIAAKESVAFENYINQIHEWKSRIDDLIDLANYARKKDIPLSKENLNRQCYEQGFFYSNGWSHLVGFINASVIDKLGIIAGGAWGKWNFYTDGESIYEANGKGEKQEPQLKHLEKFVKNFPIFEEEFYKYIDRYCADEER